MVGRGQGRGVGLPGAIGDARTSGVVRMKELRAAVATAISPGMVGEVLVNMHAVGVSDSRGAPNAARIFLEYVVKFGTQDQIEESVGMLCHITDLREAQKLLADWLIGLDQIRAKVKELGG